MNIHYHQTDLSAKPLEFEQFEEGDKVMIRLEIIKLGNRSIKAFPCSSFVEKIERYDGQVGTVTMVHKNQHGIPTNYNLTFEDGQIFQMNFNWMSLDKSVASI